MGGVNETKVDQTTEMYFLSNSFSLETSKFSKLVSFKIFFYYFIVIFFIFKIFEFFFY